MLKKHLSATALACLLYLVGQSYALASILTFDDHPDVVQNSYGIIGQYNGFNFSCIDCSEDRLDWIDTVGSSWNFGAISGDFTMLNNAGGTGVISSATGDTFSFDGLYSRVWGSDPEQTGTISGYLNGSELWSTNVNLTQTWTFFGPVAGSIDELRLDLADLFLVDNLALTETAVIPLPAAMWLFGSGLLGLAGFIRLRRTD